MDNSSFIDDKQDDLPFLKKMAIPVCKPFIMTDNHLEHHVFQNFGVPHLEHPETPHLCQ